MRISKHIFSAIGCLTFSLVLSGSVAGQQAGEEPQDSCVWCHLDLGEEERVQAVAQGVHGRSELSCAACHGGDPKLGFDGDYEAAMDPAKGFVGQPRRTDIPQLCAACHSDPSFMRRFNPRISTDQYDRYLTSVHGQRIQQGDEKVAVCTDCHGVHGINKATDARSPVYPINVIDTCARCHADAEYMAEYEIPVNQVELYADSVHGRALLERKDLAAAACNDCHGNHGASPPGAPSVAFVCGQCHLNNSELFLRSHHRQAFDDLGFPECEACHSNHDIVHPTDSMLASGEDNVCLGCHDEDTTAYQTSIAMSQLIEGLKSKIEEAESVVGEAERAGMPVSEALFQLSDADDALIKSRTQVHSFAAEPLAEVTQVGLELAEEALAIGHTALDELQFRRRGLAISLIFILILAGGLYLKIKEVDQTTGVR